ncbi:hypothetical protein ACP4OV_014798 [Aristida adscensionis]
MRVPPLRPPVYITGQIPSSATALLQPEAAMEDGEQPPPASDDWARLPADILTSVLCSLEFPDLFSAAAACASWRAAARALRRLGWYSRPQTPCLFYAASAAAGEAELYSLAAGKPYRLPAPPGPPLAGRYIFGSSHGWLATADARSELLLLNPATGEQLALPPVATVEHVTPVLDAGGGLQRYDLAVYRAGLPRREHQPPMACPVGELREYLYLKVVLSCDPSRGGGDCTAMMIHVPYRQLSFATVGGERWHWVTTSPTPEYTEYSDCIYHDGAFYAMNLQGGVHRYTITGSCASCEVVFRDTVHYMARKVYIARASSGDLLQIWRFTDVPEAEEEEEMHTEGFGIYRLDLDEQRIISIDTLGDDALLLGHGDTCCLSTKEYPNLLPGRVYFTDDSEYFLMNNKNSRRDVGIFNLVNESSHELVSPQPWMNWPNPIWITPSFTKINP